MIQQPIRFDDGAAYERMMGAWSQLVGQVFLDWLLARHGPAVDRCGLRQRSFHRTAHPALRAGRSARHRSV